MEALRALQHAQGGLLPAEVCSPIPSFGNDAAAIAAVQSGVALCDRSHWGRIQLGDADCLTFLHNQSSNDLKSRQPGQSCDTVILTSTARTLDLVTAYITEETVLLLVSPQRRTFLMQWLDRYIFFGDKVQLADLTDVTIAFSLLGPASPDLLVQCGLEALPPEGEHSRVTLAGVDVRLAAGSGLVTPGYTLIAPVAEAVPLWSALTEGGAVPLGETVWEQLRIQQGRPQPDAELTEDYNPLEAGLWHTVSFNKGCYIGQETIARLQTYQGVKQQLWGLQLQGAAPTGTPLSVDDQKVGTLTSVVETASGWVGLGYIKTKAGEAGLTVTVGDTTGQVIAVPFLTRAAQGSP